MMHAHTWSLLLTAPAAALFGLVFGLLYFDGVQRTATQIAARDGWWRPLGLTLLRLAGAVLLFGFMAQLGALPLLAAFLGFVAARIITLRAVRRDRSDRSDA